MGVERFIGLIGGRGAGGNTSDHSSSPDTTAGADILKSVKPIFDNSYQISKQAFILIWRIMPYRLSISGLKNLGVGGRGLSTGLIVPAPLPLELIVRQPPPTLH